MPLDESEFILLGHLNFESNPEQCTSRELKTIHLDIATRVVRILLYSPYQHKKNIYLQVGLVAVQFSGSTIQGYF